MSIIRPWIPALCLLLFSPQSRAVEALLIPEVISREVGLSVGGVQTPEMQTIVSREVGLFVGEDPPYREVVSREMSLVVTSPEPPPPVANVKLTVSPTGNTVTLDWSSYNQWEVRDVTHYAVYVSNRAITSLAGLTPRIVPGETFTTTFTGLPDWQDSFYAVLPVDGLGNFSPSFRYYGAYVLMPEVVSREEGLFVGAEPDPPYRQVASREVSLVVSDATPPPRLEDFKVTLSPPGDVVTLDWSHYNQWAVRDVTHYDIYVSDRAFTTNDGMKPAAQVPGESFTWTATGLEPWKDHFFAVVPVDGSGNADPAIVYSGSYPYVPEVVSREQGIFVGQWPEPLSGIEQIPIANSGFESPDFGGYTYWGQMNESQKTAFSWTAAGNQVAGGQGPAVFNNGDAWGYQNVPEGHQGLSLQGDSSVEISLQVNSPGNYTLSWHAASRGGQVNPYVVQLDGMNLSAEKSTNDPAWGKQTLPVNVATAGTHLLKFQALSTSGDNSVGIDAISLSRNVTVGVRPFNDYREVVSREVGIVVADDTTPVAVTGWDKGFRADVSRTRFGAVNLDWSDYNIWTQRDVVRFRIYLSESYFDNINAPGVFFGGYSQDGRNAATIRGLTQKKVYYFAVVAEDSSGNFDPVVYSRSTKEPIPDLFEYALSIINSGNGSLQELGITWALQENAIEYYYSLRRSSLEAGTLYEVEWSDDLEHWSTAGVEQAVVSEDETTQHIKASLPRNGAAKMFVRLKITVPE